jgi:hypothetical protein
MSSSQLINRIRRQAPEIDDESVATHAQNLTRLSAEDPVIVQVWPQPIIRSNSPA